MLCPPKSAKAARMSEKKSKRIPGDIGKGGNEADEELAEEELIFDLDALAAEEAGDDTAEDGADADSKE